jgi:ATP-dependent Clp protease ATP-binding subunit ClpC
MNGYNFSDPVRRLLQLARDEAAALRHEYVAPEHILLAMARDADGVAAAALRELKIDLAELTRRLTEAMAGGLAQNPGSDFPYTSQAKKVFEGALDEARSLKHNYVGTEHMLLGLLRLRNSPGADTLRALGVTIEAARSEVSRLLGISEAPLASSPQTLWTYDPARLALLLSVVAMIIALTALLLAIRA